MKANPSHKLKAQPDPSVVPDLEDDENTCKRCHSLMSPRDGGEPSPECDLCAQDLLSQVRAALAPFQATKAWYDQMGHDSYAEEKLVALVHQLITTITPKAGS